jgi:hypothetical protein
MEGVRMVSVRISCECLEKDLGDVRDFINRELFLFCEREHIRICSSAGMR